MITAPAPTPQFEVLDQNGTVVSNESIKGKWTIIYFYPKDDTPGCTAQACSMRDSMTAFTAHDVAVYGVSTDTGRSHQKFTDKFKLNFPLLVDRDHAMAEAFGVWVEKSMFGRTYMGIERSTVIINQEGTIVASFSKVDPDNHADFLLEELRKLRQ